MAFSKGHIECRSSNHIHSVGDNAQRQVLVRTDSQTTVSESGISGVVRALSRAFSRQETLASWPRSQNREDSELPNDMRPMDVR